MLSTAGDLCRTELFLRKRKKKEREYAENMTEK